MLLQIFLVAFRLYFFIPFSNLSLFLCVVLFSHSLTMFPSISFLPSWHSKHPQPLLRIRFFFFIHQLSSFQCDTMHTKSQNHKKWKQNVKLWQNPCKHNIFDIISIPGFSIFRNWARAILFFVPLFSHAKDRIDFFFFSSSVSSPKLVFVWIWVQAIIWIRCVFERGKSLFLECVREFYFYGIHSIRLARISRISNQLKCRTFIHFYCHQFEYE